MRDFKVAANCDVVDHEHQSQRAGDGVTIEPRKRPRQDRSQAVVETILAVTQALLLRNGLPKLTTNAIAAEAGLSIGSLYQYFPNKEAIVLELARRWLAIFLPVTQHYLEKPVPQDWAAFRGDIFEFTASIARIYRENQAMPQVLEAMQSLPELRLIVEQHDGKVIESHARWFMRVDPALSKTVADRLGSLVFETGHVAFATNLARRGAAYAAVTEDVATMHEALLRAHLKNPA
jgi:AcrR family transcriptional regulator